MGKAVIAIHGGAGAISRAQMTPAREREYVAALSAIVDSGKNAGCRGQRAGYGHRSGPAAGGVPVI